MQRRREIASETCVTSFKASLILQLRAATQVNGAKSLRRDSVDQLFAIGVKVYVIPYY